MTAKKIYSALFVLSTFIFFIGCTSMGALNTPVKKLIPKYTDAQSKFMKVDGMVVHYKDEGTGPVLVLLHGFAASLHTWDGWVKNLKQDYRIIRLDLPGFGLTGPRKDRDYSEKIYIKFLNKFFARLKIKKFFLVGNSLGGGIAWKYAVAFPERVNKLILIDSVGYPLPLPFILRLASNPLVRWIARGSMPKFLLDKGINQVFGDKSKATKKIKQRYFDLLMRKGNRNSFIDICVMMRVKSKDKNLARDVKKITVPTLVMWGEKDEWIPFRIFKKFKKDLPNAYFKSYKDAGHTPMEEDPIKTSNDAKKFFKGEFKTFLSHPIL